MKKALVLFLCLVVLILSGCGSGAYKKDMKFTYILPGDITSLDPQTCKTESEKMVASMLFEGLCRLDSTGSPIPGAARSWESNAEFTRWTFNLREGACWSNGERLLAEDFVFGMRRALMPDSKADDIESMFIIRGARELNRGEAEPETLGVYSPDSRTVVFELSASLEEFPRFTAGPRFMPCQQKYFEDTVGHYGMDATYMLTNGPFTFQSNYAWKPGESLSLAKTINHVSEEEVLPAFINLPLNQSAEDIADPVAALKDETIDLIRISGSLVEEAKDNNCEVITLNDSVYGLLLNTKNELLEDVSMRRIFLSSIDRGEVISRMGEDYTEALGIMPRCIRWQESSYQKPGNIMYVRQNPDAAEDIDSVLKDLDMKSFPTITIICPDNEYSKYLANGIIVSWNELLPNMYNLEPLSREEYNSRIATGDYQAALYSFTSGGTTPISVLTKFASTASPALLDDESYDQQLKELSFTTEAYQTLEQELINRYVFYPIHYLQSYYAVNPKARGIVIPADTGPDFTAAIKRDS